MSTNTPSNQQFQPYLPTSRNFPVSDPIQLEPELTKSYIDVARAVNLRTIGIFETVQIVTGERWFSKNPLDVNRKRQTYRKVFPFVAADLPIAHGLVGIDESTRIYGTCVTDFPDFRPLPYTSNTANGSIELNVDDTFINVNVGASSPNIIKGIVVLEYLLN
jgi:hypothetical protein